MNTTPDTGDDGGLSALMAQRALCESKFENYMRLRQGDWKQNGTIAARTAYREEIAKFEGLAAALIAHARLRAVPAVPEGWKLVREYKVGDRVMYRGIEHEIFARGDRTGTFDINQPGYPHNGTDRFLSVSPDHFSDVAAPSAPAAPIETSWTPSAANVNALPEPLRKYIAALETQCDPSGTVRELVQAKDSLAALQIMYRKLADAAPAPNEALHTFLDEAAGEGFVLAGVDAADLYVQIFPERYMQRVGAAQAGAPTAATTAELT